MGQQERHSLNLIGFALPVAAVWMGSAFCAALGLAALALAALGPGEHGTVVALKVTARFSFLLFWLAYAAGAMTTLFGSAFEPLKRRGREFGLAFASAHLVHLGLVAWITYIGAAPARGVISLFWSRRPVDLPSCVVLDPSSAKSTGVKGLVVLTRGRAQLHSLCFCEGFFGIPAIWQFQVLARILAFCRSFRRRTIVMSCRIRATRCMVAENFFKTNRLMDVRHSPGTIRDAFAQVSSVYSVVCVIETWPSQSWMALVSMPRLARA